MLNFLFVYLLAGWFVVLLMNRTVPMPNIWCGLMAMATWPYVVWRLYLKVKENDPRN